MQSSYLNESESTYQDNSAINGGQIACDQCTLNLTDNVFSRSKALRGGSFYIQNYDSTKDHTWSNIIVTDSEAINSKEQFA